MAEKAVLPSMSVEEQEIHLDRFLSTGMYQPACPNPGGAGDPSRRYQLTGPQVEPEAGWWSTGPRPLPHVVPIDDVRKLTENPQSEFFVPPYPTDKAALDWEISELAYLQHRRDLSAELTGYFPVQPPNTLPPEFRDTLRAPISDFVQLDPPPFGAIFNIGSRPQYRIENINQQHRRRQQYLAGLLPPVVQTGRQLARMFEMESPGQAHRNALNYLLYKRPEVSPPRQARVWMALEVAIYSALVAAWWYKWAAPLDRSYRQRPYEYDQNSRFRVLFDDAVDDLGQFDKCARPTPCPSPGTPRHPAYPSGHSTYSAAASEILAYFFPDERQQWNRLANNIGTARLWAGVHWRSDHIAGQRIGRAVAHLVAQQLAGDCVPRLDEVIVDPPPQDVLAAQALARRNSPNCDPNQDRIPTQRPTAFDDCAPKDFQVY